MSAPAPVPAPQSADPEFINNLKNAQLDSTSLWGRKFTFGSEGKKYSIHELIKKLEEEKHNLNDGQMQTALEELLRLNITPPPPGAHRISIKFRRMFHDNAKAIQKLASSLDYVTKSHLETQITIATRLRDFLHDQKDITKDVAKKIYEYFTAKLSQTPQQTKEVYELLTKDPRRTKELESLLKSLKNYCEADGRILALQHCLKTTFPDLGEKHLPQLSTFLNEGSLTKELIQTTIDSLNPLGQTWIEAFEKVATLTEIYTSEAHKERLQQLFGLMLVKSMDSGQKNEEFWSAVGPLLERHPQLLDFANTMPLPSGGLVTQRDFGNFLDRLLSLSQNVKPNSDAQTHAQKGLRLAGTLLDRLLTSTNSQDTQVIEEKKGTFNKTHRDLFLKGHINFGFCLPRPTMLLNEKDKKSLQQWQAYHRAASQALHPGSQYLSRVIQSVGGEVNPLL